MNWIKNKTVIIFFLSAATVLITAAAAAENPPARYIRDEAVIKYAENVVFEQITQHPAWKNTPAYTFLSNVKAIQDIRQLPRERGSVQYLYDEHYLYVRAEFADSDIVNTAEKSGGHLYSCGDLLEVFIKPLDQPYYWEIYGTPNELYTVFYYAAPGKKPISVESNQVKVTAKINGTLNNPRDKDVAFNLFLKIPRSELEKNGMKFAPGNQWLIMASRYNFSRYLTGCEQSAYPQCSINFHNSQYYAQIRFEK